jgi:hypothetical protein
MSTGSFIFKTLVARCGLSAAVTYILNDHDQEGELDGERLLLVDGAGDKVRGDVGAHDLEHGRLDIGIGQSLDVSVSHVLVPDLERLGANRVENGEETALVGRFKHL